MLCRFHEGSSYSAALAVRSVCADRHQRGRCAFLERASRDRKTPAALVDGGGFDGAVAGASLQAHGAVI